MRVVLCVAVWLMCLFSGGVQAAREFDVLPQTGQIKCYNKAGDAVACDGTGQDGEFRKGISWPNPRFVDHGNGTITDMLTGLMWLKDADCASTMGYNPDDQYPFIGNMSWLHALEFIKKMNTGEIDACGSYATGYTDWHLPTPREMESLINYGASNNIKWLTNQGFINVKAKKFTVCVENHCPYWTSTTYSGLPNHAAAVELEHNSIYWIGKNSYQYGNSLTWSVRRDEMVLVPPAPVTATGQIDCYSDTDNTKIACSGTGQDGETQQGITWPSERFIDHGDGTVTDVFTNLMWLQIFPTGNDTWQNAFGYVSGMNLGANQNYGYTDWYIPNVREGLSLISWQTFNPALPLGHPFNMTWGNATWTSSYSFGGKYGIFTDYYNGGQAETGKVGGGITYLPVRSLMFRNAVGNFYQSSGKYDTGQCVPYVRFETWLPKEACHGRAYQCFSQARDAGYYTGSAPRLGSVIVFDVDTSKNIPDGHVAIVTAIDGNRVTMQDQNWVKPLKIGVHTENVSHYNILGYIYP